MKVYSVKDAIAEFEEAEQIGGEIISLMTRVILLV